MTSFINSLQNHSYPLNIVCVDPHFLAHVLPHYIDVPISIGKPNDFITLYNLDNVPEEYIVFKDGMTYEQYAELVKINEKYEDVLDNDIMSVVEYIETTENVCVFMNNISICNQIEEACKKYSTKQVQILCEYRENDCDIVITNCYWPDKTNIYFPMQVDAIDDIVDVEQYVVQPCFRAYLHDPSEENRHRALCAIILSAVIEVEYRSEVTRFGLFYSYKNYLEHLHRNVIVRQYGGDVREIIESRSTLHSLCYLYYIGSIRLEIERLDNARYGLPIDNIQRKFCEEIHINYTCYNKIWKIVQQRTLAFPRWLLHEDQFFTSMNAVVSMCFPYGFQVEQIAESEIPNDVEYSRCLAKQDDISYLCFNAIEDIQIVSIEKMDYPIPQHYLRAKYGRFDDDETPFEHWKENSQEIIDEALTKYGVISRDSISSVLYSRVPLVDVPKSEDIADFLIDYKVTEMIDCNFFYGSAYSVSKNIKYRGYIPHYEIFSQYSDQRLSYGEAVVNNFDIWYFYTCYSKDQLPKLNALILQGYHFCVAYISVEPIAGKQYLSLYIYN